MNPSEWFEAYLIAGALLWVLTLLTNPKPPHGTPQWMILIFFLAIWPILLLFALKAILVDGRKE